MAYHWTDDLRRRKTQRSRIDAAMDCPPCYTKPGGLHQQQADSLPSDELTGMGQMGMDDNDNAFLPRR